jgi:adenine-specific DNA-methyltransferase
MKAVEAMDVPFTEGVKYAGSKLRLLPYILRLAAKTGANSVFDGFAGTTRVSQAFAQRGFRVAANDTAVWSRVFGECYLLDTRGPTHYQPLIDHLNSIPGREGWFTENYGGCPASPDSSAADGLKKPFQKRNMMKLDAIRPEIDKMALSGTERSVLLASLILALDKVDNTLGHFASYLRKWSARSYGDIKLELPRLISGRRGNRVLEGDVFAAADRVETDLAYYDPPYGSNNEKMPPSRVRYLAYYHFWKTVVLNDRPKLFGKAKRRNDSRDLSAGSVFEDFRRGDDGEFLAVDAIKRLLERTRSRHVILSYSSGGRATREALEKALAASGEIVEAVEIDLRQNVMASMHWTGEWRSEDPQTNREYLFLLRK